MRRDRKFLIVALVGMACLYIMTQMASPLVSPGQTSQSQIILPVERRGSEFDSRKEEALLRKINVLEDENRWLQRTISQDLALDRTSSMEMVKLSGSAGGGGGGDVESDELIFNSSRESNPRMRWDQTSKDGMRFNPYVEDGIQDGMRFNPYVEDGIQDGMRFNPYALNVDYSQATDLINPQFIGV